VVPDGWVQQATSSTREAIDGLQDRAGYGFQWWTTPGKAYRAAGIFGQGIWIDPDINLVVVTQSAWPGATDVPAGTARQALINAITAQRVAGAYAIWDKGIHPAGLIFGDCFAYELVRIKACPLLFVGQDFAETDLQSALSAS